MSVFAEGFIALIFSASIVDHGGPLRLFHFYEHLGISVRIDVQADAERAPVSSKGCIAVHFYEPTDRTQDSARENRDVRVTIPPGIIPAEPRLDQSSTRIVRSEGDGVKGRHGQIIPACMGLISIISCHSATSPTSPTTESTTTTTVTTVTPGVTVAGTATLADVGQTVQFTATATSADGTQQDVTDQATWSSSNPGVATVSATGLVTPVAFGQTTITAAFQDLTGTLATTFPLNLTRAWAGTGADSTGPSAFVAQLTQAGTTVSGPVTFTSNGVSFAGMLNGNVYQYSTNVPYVISGSGSAGGQTCTMAISGYAQASNSTFAGSYSGNDSCVGTVSHGQLTLVAQ